MVTKAELAAMITKVQPVKEIKQKEVLKTKSKRVKLVDPRQIDLITPAPIVKRISRKDYAGNGHWSFPEQMATTKKFGFIYVIRDLRNNMAYIGKKQYRYAGDNHDLKGTESNWPWYMSSRDSMVEQIKLHGKENFEFIVLEEYCSDRALGYAETWSIMRAETPSNQDKWYNRLVNKVSWFSTEAISSRHKHRLDCIINDHPLDVVIVS